MKFRVFLLYTVVATGVHAAVVESLGTMETVTSMGQIEKIARATQVQFWKLVPPAGNDPLYIHPDSTVRAVDWKKFKNKDFTSQMTAEMKTVNSSMYPFYRLTLVETREGELLWHNGDWLVWQTPAPLDYNEYLFAFQHFGVDSTEALGSQELLWGRSSNVGAEILLLPMAFMESYEEDMAMEAQMELLAAPMGGGAMMSMGSGVELQMDIEPQTNGTMEVFVEWASTLDSATLDLFRALDLAAANWQLATNFPTAGATNFWWNEPETNQCFFVAGTDYDEDLDGLSSARERYLYKTREDLADTDGDGLSDFFEIQNGLDPLYGDSNTNGIGDLAEANLATSITTNGSGGVLVVVPQTGWYHATDPSLNLIYLGE